MVIFLKVLMDICPFVGPLISLFFGLLWTSALGFKARVDFSLAKFIWMCLKEFLL